MHGKTVLITGATSGIGLEASVALARLGARVVMVGRDPGKTETAVAGVMARSGSREVSHLLCDFSSQAAIRNLAKTFLASHDRLEVVDGLREGDEAVISDMSAYLHVKEVALR